MDITRTAGHTKHENNVNNTNTYYSLPPSALPGVVRSNTLLPHTEHPLVLALPGVLDHQEGALLVCSLRGGRRARAGGQHVSQ